MEIHPAIVRCDIRYTDDAAHVTFFFANRTRVTITFTHGNKDAQNIVSTQWTGIEPASARVQTPEHDQKVVIGYLEIINVPEYPLLFHGYIDVLRRYTSEDSFECWRSQVAMNIEPSSSPPDESASESADESDDDSDDNMVPNTDNEEIVVGDATSDDETP